MTTNKKSVYFLSILFTNSFNFDLNAKFSSLESFPLTS